MTNRELLFTTNDCTYYDDLTWVARYDTCGPWRVVDGYVQYTHAYLAHTWFRASPPEQLAYQQYLTKLITSDGDIGE